MLLNNAKNFNVVINSFLNTIEEYWLYIYKYRNREIGTVSYTSPQRFLRTFSYMLAQQLWELLIDFDWLVY